MKVLLTGANGFIGKNLQVALREKNIEILAFVRGMSMFELARLVAKADFIYHLAGVNRPQVVKEFAEGNSGLTESLCEAIKATGRPIPVVYTSSIQAGLENPYGISKKNAEQSLQRLSAETGSPVFLYRLPNVFGKWSRPNYNSAVATFCHNIANDLPVQINDPSASVRLVYIDDVVADFLRHLSASAAGANKPEIDPVYTITVGDLANKIKAFKNSRDTLITERVGAGLIRALYSTFLSFLRPDQFAYPVTAHEDHRGRFVEMLKTPDSGQFSFFTAHPGVTRGGHYHHTKTEKFLIIHGKARFGFSHVITGETCSIIADGTQPQIVETVPGWAHDVTNIGDTELVVMLWANEIFDREKPDTIAYEV